MILHSEFANKTACRSVARTLVENYRTSKYYDEDQPFVCLLVDLRGHGDSHAGASIV